MALVVGVHSLALNR